MPLTILNSTTIKKRLMKGAAYFAIMATLFGGVKFTGTKVSNAVANHKARVKIEQLVENHKYDNAVEQLTDAKFYFGSNSKRQDLLMRRLNERIDKERVEEISGMINNYEFKEAGAMLLDREVVKSLTKEKREKLEVKLEKAKGIIGREIVAVAASKASIFKKGMHGKIIDAGRERTTQGSGVIYKIEWHGKNPQTSFANAEDVKFYDAKAEAEKLVGKKVIAVTENREAANGATFKKGSIGTIKEVGIERRIQGDPYIYKVEWTNRNMTYVHPEDVKFYTQDKKETKKASLESKAESEYVEVEGGAVKIEGDEMGNVKANKITDPQIKRQTHPSGYKDEGELKKTAAQNPIEEQIRKATIGKKAVVVFEKAKGGFYQEKCIIRGFENGKYKVEHESPKGKSGSTWIDYVDAGRVVILSEGKSITKTGKESTKETRKVGKAEGIEQRILDEAIERQKSGAYSTNQLEREILGKAGDKQGLAKVAYLKNITAEYAKKGIKLHLEDEIAETYFERMGRELDKGFSYVTFEQILYEAVDYCRKNDVRNARLEYSNFFKEGVYKFGKGVYGISGFDNTILETEKVFNQSVEIAKLTSSNEEEYAEHLSEIFDSYGRRIRYCIEGNVSVIYEKALFKSISRLAVKHNYDVSETLIRTME